MIGVYRLDYCGTKLRQEIVDPAGNVISLEELICRMNEPTEFRVDDFEEEVYSDPSELYIDESFSEDHEDFVQEFHCTRTMPIRYYAYKWNPDEDMHEVVGYAETAEEAWDLL